MLLIRKTRNPIIAVFLISALIVAMTIYGPSTKKEFSQEDLESIKGFVKKNKELLSMDKIPTVINNILRHKYIDKFPDISDEVILLSARYQQEKKKFQIGVGANSQNLASIRMGVLNVLKSMEEIVNR